jgi:hypothetical protein
MKRYIITYRKNQETLEEIKKVGNIITKVNSFSNLYGGLKIETELTCDELCKIAGVIGVQECL